MNCNYDLSLEEQKLILTLASMVQPTDEEFKPYDFKISTFMELLGVENQAKYTEIPKITKELMKKVFEIQEGNTLLQVAWLSSARYEKGSGMVTVKFSPDLKPYMLQLKEKFTQYQLANILTMKSKYSPRIYEILKCNEFKKQGYIVIAVDELKKMLGITEKSYDLYSNFKIKIINQAQKELKEKTDIRFDFEEIKTGRKVTSIKFSIRSNKAKGVNNPKEKVPLDEVVTDRDETIVKDNKQGLQEGIEKIVNMMKEYHVTPSEAMKIYNSAEGDMYHITEVYEHFKNKGADNFIGLMIVQVKPGAFNPPKKNIKTSSFNNFEPREYDYDTLEKRLLGWDDERTIQE